MARKKIEVRLQDRDQELTFEIQEMSATQLEGWMIRALLLLAGSNIDVPKGNDLKAAGAFLATKGLSALGSIDYDKAKPLLDEMLSCCSRVAERVKERCTAETVDNYIQDVSTLFKLRMEAIKLNLGFLKAEPESPSASLENINIGQQ